MQRVRDHQDLSTNQPPSKRFIEGYKGDIKAREQAIALAIQSHVLKPYNLLPNSVKLN